MGRRRKTPGGPALSSADRKLRAAIGDAYRPQCGVNPGFEAVPWTPRREMSGEDGKGGAAANMDRGVGKYCPRHLHFLTDQEKTREHYPLARVDARGEPDRFCWCCGRPLTAEGLSAKAHKGYGKPCPACGFRRKQNVGEGQRRALLANGGAPSPETRAKADRTHRVPRVSELMTIRANEEADRIMAPYFEALALSPRLGWSPGTKLGFFSEQVGVAERLLDRVEGKPVNRNRHVDAEDNDVLRDDELSPATLAQLVAAIATGADTEAILGEDAEEAEFEPLEDGGGGG